MTSYIEENNNMSNHVYNSIFVDIEEFDVDNGKMLIAVAPKDDSRFLEWLIRTAPSIKMHKSGVSDDFNGRYCWLDTTKFAVKITK